MMTPVPNGPPPVMGAVLNMSNDNPAIRHRAIIRAINEALGTFRDLSSSMPVGEVMMFLTVALNEGESQGELAERAGMKKSTASRYLLDLSDNTRVGGQGYGLVNRDTDPAELRRNMYSLTPKGRVVLGKLVSGAKGVTDGNLS